VIGGKTRGLSPFTGTLMKVPPSGAQVISLAQAQIKPDPPPERPMDLCQTSYGFTKPDGWIEGAAWAYAGASPIVPNGCSCPNMRHCTDWYKRSFVPEAYRHSVGILDAAGNLIMHLGRYGNADSGRGPDSPIPVGEDGIGFCHMHYVTATDRYLCVSDIGNERIVVLKLGCHAEETAGIQ
jgi:hypothetical protein